MKSKAKNYPSELGRNIVLIVGQNVTGKTTAYNILSRLLATGGISVAPESVKDISFYLQWLARDDAQGGYGHHHDWCVPASPQEITGHTHDEQHTNILPFMVTSQEIIDNAFFDFFSALSELPQDGRIYFAELSGGTNGNPGFEPQAAIDVSLERIHNLLYNDAFPTKWLHRVLAVIHPYAAKRDRYLANRARPMFHHTSLAMRNVLSKKGLTALDVFGKDDFSAIEPLLREYGAPHVYSVENHFNASYDAKLSTIAQAIFQPPTRRAAQPRRDIIMVMGQHASGKPHILEYLQHQASMKGLVFENTVISDLPLLIEAVHKDDEQGGYHHYHPWCTNKVGGHDHTGHPATGAFTVVGNEIIDAMQQAYFSSLNTLPHTEKVWLAELSGGENTNPFNEPAFETDCSFKRIAASMQQGKLPTDWLDRVFAVIHPVVSSDQVLSYVNDIEYIHSLDTHQQAIIREKRSEVVLNIFGRDDFFHMEDLLHKHAVPHVYSIRHDGTELFALRLKKILDGFLATYTVNDQSEAKTS